MAQTFEKKWDTMNTLNVWLKNNGVSNPSRMWGILSPIMEEEPEWTVRSHVQWVYWIPNAQSLSDADPEQ